MSGLSGIENVMKNLNKEITKIEGKTMTGLIQAAIIVRRDMEKTPPLTPIDTGNLRASFFVVTSTGAVPVGSGDVSKYASIDEKKAFVVLGYTANYAWFVHENVDAKFQRPNAGAKWFEAAIIRNTNPILNVIKKFAST